MINSDSDSIPTYASFGNLHLHCVFYKSENIHIRKYHTFLKVVAIKGSNCSSVSQSVHYWEIRYFVHFYHPGRGITFGIMSLWTAFSLFKLSYSIDCNQLETGEDVENVRKVSRSQFSFPKFTKQHVNCANENIATKHLK